MRILFLGDVVGISGCSKIKSKAQKLNLGEKINLVIHDWGCGLGLKFARLHPEIISSITFMEGITVPLKWEQWPEAGTKIFKCFFAKL